MRKLTKKEKLAAELLGLTEEEFGDLKTAQDQNDNMREAQAVLLFVEKPDEFLHKKCDNCKKYFLTSYQFVTVCSTKCRVESLEKMGVIWNPMHTADERWKRAQIPTEYSIPPKALEVLLTIAKSMDHSSPTVESEQVSDKESFLYPELAELISNTAQQYNDAHKDPEPLPPQLTSAELKAEQELARLFHL